MTDANGSDINLPGWADQSIWGYDPLLEFYWAQLCATATAPTAPGSGSAPTT